MNLYRLLPPFTRLEITPLGQGRVDLHIGIRDRNAGTLQLSRDDALTLIAIFTAPDPVGEISTDGEVNWFTHKPPEIVIDEIGRIYNQGEIE